MTQRVQKRDQEHTDKNAAKQDAVDKGLADKGKAQHKDADHKIERIKKVKDPHYMRSYRYKKGSSYTKLVGRSISAHLSRFLALFAIIALGAGVFSGVRMFVPDMYTTAEVHFKDQHLFDLKVNFPLGLDDKDLPQIRALPSVEGAMGAHSAEISAQGDKRSYQISLESIPKELLEASQAGEGSPHYLNKLRLQEGRLPQNSHEIVVSNQRKDITLGEELEVTRVVGSDDISAVLQYDRFTVVGFVHSPTYLSTTVGDSPVSGVSLSNYAYSLEDAFAQEGYQCIYLRAKESAKHPVFSQAYKDQMSALAEEVKALAPASERRHRQSLEDEIQSKLDQGAEELGKQRREATEKLSAGQAEIDKNKALLADKSAELRAGEAQYEAGREELERKKADAEARINQAETELEQAAQELAHKEPELAQAREKGAELKAQKEQLLAQSTKIDEALGGFTQLDTLKAQAQQAATQLGMLELEKAQIEARIAELKQKLAELEGAGGAAPGTSQPSQPIQPGDTPAESSSQPKSPSENSREEQIAQLKAEITKLEAVLGGLTQKKEELAAGQAQLAAAIEQLETQLTQAGDRATLEAQRAQIQGGIAQIDAGLQQIEAAISAYDQGRARYEAGRAELEAQKNSVQSQIAQAKEELAQAYRTITDGRAQLAQGQKKLSSAQEELDSQRREAESEFIRAERKLEQAAQDKEDIPSLHWYVLGRNSNVSFTTYESNMSRIAQITTIFPFFFFLVAGFVTLITMTRMVESERIEIGTLKGLGYTQGKIAQKYLIFGLLASILGAIFGISLGIYFIPKIIWLSYASVYPELDFILGIHPKDCIIASLIVILMTLGTTYAAIRFTLLEAPTKLMVPRAPRPGKRILLERLIPLWRRLSFTSKVTARNLFRYKKRLIMTAAGVAGCTALLLTGFGVSDHIKEFVDIQYYVIDKYNLTIHVDGEHDPRSLQADHGSDAAHALDRVLSSSDNSWAYFSSTPGLAENKHARPEDIPYISGDTQAQHGGSGIIQLLNARSDIHEPQHNTGVVRDVDLISTEGSTLEEEQETLSHFIDLRDAYTKDSLQLSKTGVIITKRLAENLQLKKGDQIELSILGSNKEPGESAFLTIEGIADYYIKHKVFISKELYEKSFGKSPEFSLVYAHADKDEERRSTQIEELKNEKSITALTIPEDTAALFNDLKNNLDAMIALFIFLSGALALIVLYNLTNINIEERKSEIATLKVLGFYTREVDSYVFRETFILSIMGIIPGLFLGTALCTYIMRNAEIDAVSYIREIAPLSYVLSCVITLIFTFLVMLLMHKKLKDINMVSSLKALD